VFNCYVENAIPVKIYNEESYEFNMLYKSTNIETDNEKSKRIVEGIVKNVSYDTLFISYNAFLSGQKNTELTILKYLISAFKVGPKINHMLAVDYVLDTIKLQKNTFGEAHRLKGLIKFRYISNNLYYAPIHPDNNVLEHVGKHFVKRVPTQNFIIHDKNRNLAFVYDTKNFSIIDIPADFKIPEFSEEEKLYQSLWKTFFKTIAIKERTNKRLQMQFMPKKYWQDLVEME
jgi:probable DNA metabolism protein